MDNGVLLRIMMIEAARSHGGPNFVVMVSKADNNSCRLHATSSRAVKN
jgi:hypothetical protein